MPDYRYDHIHRRRPDPNATARFFETMFGAEVKRDDEVVQERLKLLPEIGTHVGGWAN